LKSENNLILFL